MSAPKPWSAVIVLALVAAPVAARGQVSPDPAPERGWIGVSFVYPLAFAESGPGADIDGSGIVIDAVYSGSPGERAGLRAGDAIVEIDGAAMAPEDLRRFGLELEAGERVVFTVRRGSRALEIPVISAPRPTTLSSTPLPPGMILRLDSVRSALLRRFDSVRIRLRAERGEAARGWTSAPERGKARTGVAVVEATDELSRPPRPLMLGRSFVAGARMTPLNPGLAEYFGVDQGLLVTEVLDGGPAAAAGLVPGDVVVSVADRPARTLAELRRGLVASSGAPVLVRIVRKGDRMDVRLPR